MVAKSIAAAHVPVIAAGLIDLPEAFERLAATESNVGRLEKAGVVVAISTINMTEPTQQRRLNQQAGNLVAIAQMPGMTGLDWGQAFAAIHIPSRAGFGHGCANRFVASGQTGRHCHLGW